MKDSPANDNPQSFHQAPLDEAVGRLVAIIRQRRPHVIVTYSDDKLSHIRVEFSFDVLQVAQGRYAPASYRAFVGFKVNKPVLERAFLDTYGLEMKDLFKSLEGAVEDYTSGALDGYAKEDVEGLLAIIGLHHFVLGSFENLHHCCAVFGVVFEGSSRRTGGTPPRRRGR
jgi:hypothetical protein